MSLPEAILIEKIVTGGYGLGRMLDGRVVLVHSVLPGETVAIEPVKTTKGYIEARPLKVITPSPTRIVPPCRYYLECGGCDLQHTDIDTQLRIKSDILKEQLLRSRAVTEEQLEKIWQPPLAAANPTGYRQRIRLQVEKGLLGYHKKNSHAVVPIQTCLLARPEINQALARLRESTHARQLFAKAKDVELIVNDTTRRIVLVIHLLRRPTTVDFDTAAAIAKAIPEIEAITFSIKEADKKKSYHINDDGNNELLVQANVPGGVRGQTLRLSMTPGGFCQVNSGQNHNLIRCLLDWAGSLEKQRVLDLFCGMGNFSLPLARYARQVVGIEIDRQAVANAENNALANNITNCLFRRCAAERGAGELVANNESFDLVLLDPPRQGCKELIQYLPGLQAGKIIYISCDPATLVRDLKALQPLGYGIEKIRLIDMFPQTHHVETMVLLRRDG